MNKRKIHAMKSEQASLKKISGHKKEEIFNLLFGDKKAKINYSGPSSDCIIVDEELFDKLKKELKIEGKEVSLKSGDTIQIHLGLFPELTNMKIWKKNLGQKKVRGKVCTYSLHGIDFNTQKHILNSFAFWKKYLGKGDVLCYYDSHDKWYFFNMKHVINFIIKNFEWRLLETGRIKGDCSEKQFITYEYRSEPHKLCFVLGAHGGKKGKEFINLLKRKIPFVEEVRDQN